MAGAVVITAGEKHVQVLDQHRPARKATNQNANDEKWNLLRSFDRLRNVLVAHWSQSGAHVIRLPDEKYR